MKHFINTSKQNWHMTNPSSPCYVFMGESLLYQGGKEPLNETNEPIDNDQNIIVGIIVR